MNVGRRTGQRCLFDRSSKSLYKSSKVMQLNFLLATTTCSVLQSKRSFNPCEARCLSLPITRSVLYGMDRVGRGTGVGSF